MKLDAYGGVALSQDSNSSGHQYMYKLWAETSDHSWRFSFLSDIITALNIPSYVTVAAAPESAKLGVWQRLSVHFDKAKKIVLMKIDDVPAASGYYIRGTKGSGPFLFGGILRVGAVESTSGAASGFLDGTVSAVQTATGADLPAGQAVNCSSVVYIYGITSDKKLTLDIVEPYTSTVVRRLTSTATFSAFTPLSMAGLNNNTILVTSTAGVLYRVDVTGVGTALTFAAPVQLGTGWSLTQLTYDGSYLTGTTSAGALRRYSIIPLKPVLADITDWITIGSSGFTLNTLAATAMQFLVGTKTSDGSLHGYLTNGPNEFYDWTFPQTWTGISHIVSPGAGLYYVRNNSGVVTLYRDANPENGVGTDITTIGTVTDPVGWNQTKMSAVPNCRIITG